MNLALIVVAALVAEPADSVQVFSWETASQVIWLEERRPDPKAKPPKPFEWKGFFKIRSNGQLPVNGVFQVDGWPVQPEVEWVSRGLRYRKNAPPVVVGPNSGGQFDLLVREPGRYTFKASVGKVWSAQVTIEAKTFPFQLGMRQPDFLEKYGNPDVIIPGGPRRYERWLYKGWTSLAVYCDRNTGMQAETFDAEQWTAWLMAEDSSSTATMGDHAIQPILNTWVAIVNRKSGLAMNVSGNRKNPGARIGQWDDPPRNDNSHWLLEPVGDRYFRLRNHSTSLYLGLGDSEHGMRKAVQVAASDSHDQHWEIRPLRDGFFAIINRQSNQCFGVIPNRTARGDGIYEQPFVPDSPELQWMFEPIATENPSNPNHSNNDDLKALIGTWDVRISTHYRDHWTFLENGVVTRRNSKMLGKWTSDGSKVKIIWHGDNVWESFRRPLNPQGTTGDSHAGRGIVRAIKVAQ